MGPVAWLVVAPIIAIAVVAIVVVRALIVFAAVVLVVARRAYDARRRSTPPTQ